LLRRLGGRDLDAGHAFDANGDLRLIFPMPRWEDYLVLAFDEIRHYGADSVQVVRRLRSAPPSLEKNGATSAKSQGSDQRSHRIEAHREMILSVIKVKPDMTLVQIAEMLEAETGASFAPSSVWRFLDRHAITFKKTAHAAEQDRPDVAAARGLA
jgi:transposase